MWHSPTLDIYSRGILGKRLSVIERLSLDPSLYTEVSVCHVSPDILQLPWCRGE
jgi:hypothetical protein